MPRPIPTLVLALGALIAAPLASAAAPDLDQDLLAIQHQWAHINYELPKADRSAAFETLERQAGDLAARYPGRAEPLVWEGITLSTHAGAKGGFGALGLAKEARARLEQAEQLDPLALHGSIQTSLGTLYHKVPGWPLGFGDDDKAETYLKQALALNPDGIDPNYFYADYLYDQGRYAEAEAAVQKALAAPARPDRPLADQGRRAEARALQARVRAELGADDPTHTAAR